VKAAAAALAACGLLAFAAPTLAVDRTLGSDVPKPAASGEPWTDAQIAALDANLDLMIAGAHSLRGAHVGVFAVDARDGRVLYQRNPDDLFQPASTLKLVVGSAALEKLGPNFKFHTEAVAGGPVVAGTLNGALIVHAGGDPFLGVADFDALAQSVAAQGIRVVRDGVRFDVSRYEGASNGSYPPGWSWDDLAYGFGAPVNALAFEENAVHLTVTPGTTVDGPARVRSSPLAVVHSFVEDLCSHGIMPVVVPAVTTAPASAPDTVELIRGPFGCTQVVGAIPSGATPDTLDAAVSFPTVYAAEALRDALARAGIRMGQFEPQVPPDLYLRAAPPGATVLWSHDSEPLRDVVADVWIPSDNLAAEMLLRELGVAGGTLPGTTAGGIAAETAWLKSFGVDTDLMALADGSGLSAYDRITPRALVSVLQRDWAGPLHDTVLDDLPIAGVRGTLRSSYAGTRLERHVFAKTGTLSRAGALAGYLASDKHGAVIFAFSVDEWVGDQPGLDTVRARVLTHLIED